MPPHFLHTPSIPRAPRTARLSCHRTSDPAIRGVTCIGSTEHGVPTFTGYVPGHFGGSRRKLGAPPTKVPLQRKSLYGVSYCAEYSVPTYGTKCAGAHWGMTPPSTFPPIRGPASAQIGPPKRIIHADEAITSAFPAALSRLPFVVGSSWAAPVSFPLSLSFLFLFLSLSVRSFPFPDCSPSQAEPFLSNRKERQRERESQ